MPNDYSKIINLIDQIENRLTELSPKTLEKIENSLDFAVFQMNEADVLNAEFITEKESV